MRSRTSWSRWGSGAAGEIVRRPAQWRQPDKGQAAVEVVASVAVAGAEVAVDLAGDVTLAATDDLSLGQSLGAAPLHVRACARFGAHRGQHNPPQRMVGLAVTGGVETAAGDLAGRGRDWSGAAQMRPPRLAAQPVWVVAGGDEPDGSGVGTYPVEGKQARSSLGHERDNRALRRPIWSWR